MKRGKGDRFTTNGIDCYFLTAMTDNRFFFFFFFFKQQCRDDLVRFVGEDDRTCHARTIRYYFSFALFLPFFHLLLSSSPVFLSYDIFS